MEQEEEISLLDLINILKEFVAEIKAKGLFVILVTISASVLLGGYANLSAPKYVASTTMMLENSKGGSMNGALALASQFGLMSGGGSAEINEEKFIEIISSETIVKKALTSTVSINNEKDLLANHLIDLYGYNEVWATDKTDSLEGFRFEKSKGERNLLENRVLNILYLQVADEFLTTEKSKSGIIRVSVNTKSEEFSKELNEALIKALTSFYVSRITGKGRTNVAIIQKRVDSVAVSLRNAENELAMWKDANFRLVKAQGMMEEMNLRRNVEVNNSIYIEGIKQLEISKFKLLQDTPFIQTIDVPSLPIEPVKKSSLKFGIIGFILGLFLSSFYVFVRKKYKDLLLEGEKLALNER